MLRQLTTYLILTLVLVNGCAIRKSDSFIDTVHGYFRCKNASRDIELAMLEIRHEYGIQHLRTENQSTDSIKYNTTSYLLPENNKLIVETVAENGPPIHLRFKMEPGGLYSREEIMIELARRINVLPEATPLEVKTPLEDSDNTREKNS